MIFSYIFLGENLDGAQLSFTTHSQSCEWERKNKVYTLKVDASDPHERLMERAYVTFNLPYYNSTLYMCLTPTNSNEVFHQGNRYQEMNFFYFIFSSIFLFFLKTCIKNSSYSSRITCLGNNNVFNMSSFIIRTFLWFKSRINVTNTA